MESFYHCARVYLSFCGAEKQGVCVCVRAKSTHTLLWIAALGQKTGKRAWYAELIRTTHIGAAVEGTIVINCVSVEGVVVGGSCAIAITQPGVLAQAAPEGRRSRRGDTLDRGYEYHTAHSDCQSCLAAHQCSSTGRSNSSSLSATCWSTLRIF